MPCIHTPLHTHTQLRVQVCMHVLDHTSSLHTHQSPAALPLVGPFLATVKPLIHIIQKDTIF